MATSAGRHGSTRERDGTGPALATPPAAAHLHVGASLAGLGRLAGNRAVARALAGTTVHPGAAVLRLQRKRELTEQEFLADHPKPLKAAEPPFAFAASEQAYRTSLGAGADIVAQIATWKAERHLYDTFWKDVDVQSRGLGRLRRRAEQRLAVKGSGAKLVGLGYRTHAHAARGEVDLRTARVPGQPGDLVPDADYVNRYLHDERRFVADWNFATHDAMRQPRLQLPAKPPGNSEIIWHQYKRALAELGLPKAAKRHGLRELHRATVINPNTVNTIYWSDGAAAKGPEHVALPGTDDFTALLGSDNGRSAGRLLVQHGISMGATDIERIRYRRSPGSVYEMWIEFRLDDAPAAPAGLPPVAGNAQNDNNAPVAGTGLNDNNAPGGD